LNDCVSAVELREKRRVDTEEWYESVAPLRKLTTLEEVFTAFGYTVDDRIEHREIVIMYRAVEAAIEFEIQKLIQSDIIGSAAHSKAKELRVIITSIRTEFDDTYSLTKPLSFIQRKQSTVSIEKFFKYEYDSGKLTVNFAALSKPELPHYLVVFRTAILPDSLRELLVAENGFCEVKNSEPLDKATIKSLIGPEYDRIQASGNKQ
jgi:hypothetical protein